MGKLFELVEAYRHRYEPHEPSYSQIAERVGVSRQTLLNWRTPTKLLNKDHLRALAAVTQVPYARVLDALLFDIGYLHEEQEAVADRNRRRDWLDVYESVVQLWERTNGDLREARSVAAQERRRWVGEDRRRSMIWTNVDEILAGRLQMPDGFTSPSWRDDGSAPTSAPLAAAADDSGDIDPEQEAPQEP